MNILFICEGNIMRSQMAEVFYNALTGTSHATSAGAGTWSGRPVDPGIAKVMKARGLDTTGLTSTVLTREMFEAADRVVWFPTSYMPDYVKDSPKSELWDVSDPWYMTGDASDHMARVRDRIEEKVKELIKGEHESINTNTT